MIAAIDRVLGVLERVVVAAEAEFGVGSQIEPLVDRGVARTEPHRLLDIGSRLLKMAQIVFPVASERQQRGRVRVNRKPGIDGAHSIFGPG